MIDVGLAVSIALSVVILMVSLWIQKPLEFSAFPTVLLVATILRLALNISTTRLILAHGSTGTTAAGYIINGFASLVMGGDFVIGIIVFLILITINFLVITKGATRIAEVGARFTLDAIPGKQMAIDADLSAGLIDEKIAQRRRRELEEESAFFGSMDGASKFVRGDAIAGLIILAVNIFGGVVIGVSRHGMTVGAAADVYTKLSVGDGLVSQIPALIISLAAGLLVAKGGTRGSADKAVIGQLGGYPTALTVTAALLFILGLVPNLPFLPFALLGAALGAAGIVIPKQRERDRAEEEARNSEQEQRNIDEARASIREQLRTAEIELCFSKELSTPLMASYDEISSRVARMRRKFARQYGFVVPEIRIREDIDAPARVYQVRVHGAVVATHELRVREHIVILAGGRKPDVPGEEIREPAFGMPAISIADAYVMEVKRQGFTPIDSVSVLLTHLSEVVRNNLAQLLSYKDMRALIDRLDSGYQKLVEEIVPSQMTYSGLQAVLKKLLSERVSIRNLNLVLEAVAECGGMRRPEQIAEFVRSRLGQQICSELQVDGAIRVLRLGNRWDLVFHQSLKRDAKGDPIEFDVDPRLMDEFVAEASSAIRDRLERDSPFALVTTAEARPYVRMIVERMFPTLQVLSQLEIARGFEVKLLGSIS
jgi:flagellar biosynthesis protein FlhA